MDQQIIETIRILAKYPHAIKATKDNLKVGDVLCNHADVPCVYLDQDRYNWMIGCGDFDYFWIIASTQ